MDTISLSISQLKTNPAQAIAQADDYPVAIASRNKIKAYLVGGLMFEKIIEFLEDWEDTRAIKSIKKSDWGKGKSLDKAAKELGIKI
jgi:PHD/YefM family antitoxin component YafN of YafNO toxin-antitoxin module